MTWLRIFMVVIGLGQIAGFVLVWAIGGDFNSTILINGFLCLLNALLTHLNDEAHDIIREQQRIIVAQHQIITGGR